MTATAALWQQLEDHLRGMDMLHAGRGRPSIEGFVLAHGRRWEGAPRPAGVPLGEPKQCFANAQQLAVGTRYAEAEGLVYVEGYAVSRRLNTFFPVLHGWLMDRHGRAIDVTWDDAPDALYLGVPLRTDYVWDHAVATDMWCSVLDSYRSGFALVSGKDRPEDALHVTEEARG